MHTRDTKVLVLGARGMLGKDLCDILRPGCVLYEWDIKELDTTDSAAVIKAICELSPAEVINCAAYTDVDGCESNRKTAMEINGIAPGYIGEACSRVDARMIQISTDYVFDGAADRPYLEDDITNPASAYGETKLAGEMAVVDSGCRFAVIRTQWLYGANGKNFVDTIRRLAVEKDTLSVVDDQFGRPTWSREFAGALAEFIVSDKLGTYHLAASGRCSWFEVAKEIVKILKLPVSIEAVSTSVFPRPAKRPANGVLGCERIKTQLGIEMRHWREALREYLSSN